MTRLGVRHLGRSGWWGLPTVVARAALVCIFALSLVGCRSDESLLTTITEQRDVAGLGANDFQDAILADGVVTGVEYEMAIFASLACTTSQGVEAWVDEGESGLYSFSMPGTDENARIFETCHDEFVGFIEAVYADSLPKDLRDIDAVRAIQACLLSEGIDATAETSLESVIAAAKGTSCG